MRGEDVEGKLTPNGVPVITRHLPANGVSTGRERGSERRDNSFVIAGGQMHRVRADLHLAAQKRDACEREVQILVERERNLPRRFRAAVGGWRRLEKTRMGVGGTERHREAQ